MLLVPRRIINPTCTSNFSSGTTTTDLVLTAYIEPVGGVQYYRVHPKYFYATSGGSITVCLSFFYDKPGLNKHYINQFILNSRIKDQKRLFLSSNSSDLFISCSHIVPMYFIWNLSKDILINLEFCPP